MKSDKKSCSRDGICKSICKESDLKVMLIISFSSNTIAVVDEKRCDHIMMVENG